MKKIISCAITILIVFVSLRELLRLMTGDFATSVVPGGHSTIYLSEWTLSIAALSILFLTGLTAGLFKLTNHIVGRIMRLIGKK